MSIVPHARTGLLLFLTLAAVSSTGRAQDRWQITLHNGSVLWDLELQRLSGDTLVFRPAQGGQALHLPVMSVDALRLVQKSEKRQFAPDGQGTGNALTGGADMIWQLTLLDKNERLKVLQEVLRAYPPDST
ncbi:MAG TPA: hypothetical protein VLT79_10960 [Gemmatimonadales bacterium]|nr:hypothetical protein [Gemmatimonadales bacterium]